jgi:hypothetical protein
MDECRDHLSRMNQINKDDIVIFQIEYKSPNFKIPIVEYGLFAIYGTKKLSINYCNNLKARYYIPLNITDYKDYKYNPENKYYYDKCHSYTSENNTDLTLKDRREDFNNNNRSLCESMCTFKGYKNNVIECECNIKHKFNSFMNVNVSKYNSIYRFKIPKKNTSNFWVLKCLLIIFSKEIILSNLCSQIILGIILISIVGAIIFYIKEKSILSKKIKILIQLTLLNGEKINSSNKKKNRRKKNKKFNNNMLYKGKNSFLSIENNNNSKIVGKSSSRTGLKLNFIKSFSLGK